MPTAGMVTQYFLSLQPGSINTISLGLVIEANTNATSLAPYEVVIAGEQVLQHKVWPHPMAICMAICLCYMLCRSATLSAEHWLSERAVSSNC